MEERYRVAALVMLSLVGVMNVIRGVRAIGAGSTVVAVLDLLLAAFLLIGSSGCCAGAGGAGSATTRVARPADHLDVGQAAGWPDPVVGGRIGGGEAVRASRLEATGAGRQAFPAGVLAALGVRAATTVGGAARSAAHVRQRVEAAGVRRQARAGGHATSSSPGVVVDQGSSTGMPRRSRNRRLRGAGSTPSGAHHTVTPPTSRTSKPTSPGSPGVAGGSR